MEELSLITTSKRNPHFIWSSDLEVEVWDRWKSNQHSPLSPESTNVKKWFAENVTLDFHQKLPTAERESVVTTETSDWRRRLRADLASSYHRNSRITKRSYKHISFKVIAKHCILFGSCKAFEGLFHYCSVLFPDTSKINKYRQLFIHFDFKKYK